MKAIQLRVEDFYKNQFRGPLLFSEDYCDRKKTKYIRCFAQNCKKTDLKNKNVA